MRLGVLSTQITRLETPSPTTGLPPGRTTPTPWGQPSPASSPAAAYHGEDDHGGEEAHDNVAHQLHQLVPATDGGGRAEFYAYRTQTLLQGKGWRCHHGGSHVPVGAHSGWPCTELALELNSLKAGLQEGFGGRFLSIWCHPVEEPTHGTTSLLPRPCQQGCGLPKIRCGWERTRFEGALHCLLAWGAAQAPQTCLSVCVHPSCSSVRALRGEGGAGLGSAGPRAGTDRSWKKKT